MKFWKWKLKSRRTVRYSHGTINKNLYKLFCSNFQNHNSHTSKVLNPSHQVGQVDSMTSSPEWIRFSSTSIPRGRQFSKLASIQLLFFLAATLLLLTVVEKASLAAASGAQSFEYPPYCQKLCIWGRGGNLCRCNAVHFVGKRRTLMSFPTRIRTDRSTNVSPGSQKPSDQPQLANGPVVPLKELVSGSNIYVDDGRLMAHATAYRVARRGHQLDKVDGSSLSGYRGEDEGGDGRHWTTIFVEGNEDADEAKKGLGIAENDRDETLITAGRPVARTRSGAGKLHRYGRQTDFPADGEDVRTTSVGPVINVFFRRADNDDATAALAGKWLCLTDPHNLDYSCCQCSVV